MSRERATPCRFSTIHEQRRLRHMTWNDDAVCDRCKVKVAARQVPVPGLSGAAAGAPSRHAAPGGGAGAAAPPPMVVPVRGCAWGTRDRRPDGGLGEP